MSSGTVKIGNEHRQHLNQGEIGELSFRSDKLTEIVSDASWQALQDTNSSQCQYCPMFKVTQDAFAGSLWPPRRQRLIIGGPNRVTDIEFPARASCAPQLSGFRRDISVPSIVNKSPIQLGQK